MSIISANSYPPVIRKTLDKIIQLMNQHFLQPYNVHLINGTDHSGYIIFTIGPGAGAVMRIVEPDVVRHHGNRVFTILIRSEEHTSELQSRGHLVCRLLLQKKKP